MNKQILRVGKDNWGLLRFWQQYVCRVRNFISDQKISIIRPKSDLLFTKNQTKIRLYDGKNQTILELSNITAKNHDISC